MGPVRFGGAHGNAEGVRNFFMGEADEVAQLNHLRFHRMGRGEFIERVIHGQQLIVVARKRQLHLF